MLHKDIITWEDLTVTRPYTDSTFIKTIYNVLTNTLTVEERPNQEFNYIPNWAVLIRIGDKIYFEHFENSEEIAKKIFDKIDESWRKKGIRLYKPHEALTQYPDLVSGRLGLIEIRIKKHKIKFLPEEITSKAK